MRRLILATVLLAAPAFSFEVHKGMSLGEINQKIDEYYAALPATATSKTTAMPTTYAGSTYEIKRTYYLAQVIRVLDGDTLEAAVVIWPDTVVTKKFRVAGIDCPEIHPSKKDHLGNLRSEHDRDAERMDAETAKQLVEGLTMGPKSIVYVVHAGDDKYGRELVDVFVRDDRVKEERFVSLAAVLIDAGLANPYLGGRKETWTQN